SSDHDRVPLVPEEGRRSRRLRKARLSAESDPIILESVVLSTPDARQSHPLTTRRHGVKVLPPFDRPARRLEMRVLLNRCLGQSFATDKLARATGRKEDTVMWRPQPAQAWWIGLLSGALILAWAAGPAAAQGKPIRIGEINSYSGLATVYTFPYKEGLL